MDIDDKITQGVQQGDHNTQNNFFISTNIELAKQLGIAESAIDYILKIIDQQHIPPEDRYFTIRTFADRYTDLLKEVTRLNSEDPEVSELQKQAKEALERADFKVADSLLAKAIEYDIVAAGAIKENYKRRMLSAANNQFLKADSLHAQASLDEATNAYAQALQYAEDAEEIGLAAICRGAIGTIYIQRDLPQKANEYLEPAVKYFDKNHDTNELYASSSFNSLGLVRINTDKVSDAIRCFERALEIIMPIEETHPLVSTCLNNLGLAWLEKASTELKIHMTDFTIYFKSISKAVENFKGALKSCKGIQPNTPIYMQNLGRALCINGEFDEALNQFNRALVLFSAYKGRHELVLETIELIKQCEKSKSLTVQK